MKKILLSTSILATLIFTGCGSTNSNVDVPLTDVKQQNYPSPKDGETTFENIKDSDTLIKVSNKLKGKHQAAYLSIVPTINNINVEVKKRGYEYYQIVSPKQISNLEGFPINNKDDLSAFLNPQVSMPTHTLNLLETRKTLIDSQESQDVVDVPFLIFGTTELELIVRMIKESNYDEIVWNVNN